MPVIGYLGSTSPEDYAMLLAEFRRGLSEAGYVEGRNVTIEYRWADGQYDRLPALADDLVRRKVAVIATASSTGPALAAKAATATIPVVFTMGADPVKVGLVATLSQPGGNLTGVTYYSNSLVPKRLELLRELVPTADPIAILVNPSNSNAESDAQDAHASARSLNLSLQTLNASTVTEIDGAFATLVRRGIKALLLEPDAFLGSRREQIVTLARYQRIPTIFAERQFTTIGGLISYGARHADLDRQAGAYVGRILKGEKPADLPAILPTQFELAVNLKAAKAIDLTVPLTLLNAADEVIE
jgi:putative ABC transport system substrate-binding protein